MIKTTFHYLQFNCIMRLPITYFIIIIVALLAAIPRSRAEETVGTQAARLVKIDNVHTPPDSIDMSPIIAMRPHCSKPKPICIYELPISSTTQSHDWHRLWINTATLGGAFVGTLFVLELLPEDATNWNRASIQQYSPGTRWVRNVLKRGPEWDGDKFIFNYVLHPYAGAAYFMAARSCGFNYYQSLLYTTLISTVLWEFGIEGCMERPSYQDIFITPLAGSIMGECFYQLKHHIVNNGYTLWGSPVLGNIVAFLIDPVNEVLGIFDGNPARKYAKTRKRPAVSSTLMPYISNDKFGFSITCTF